MKKSVFYLFACLLFLAVGCKPLRPVYLGYSNFRFEKIGLDYSVFGADLKLYNPNGYALNMERGDVDIYINQHLLGHSYIDTLVNLKARDTTAVRVRLKAAAKDLLGVAGQVISHRAVDVKIQGSARVGRSGVFITLPVNYEGQQHLGLPNFLQF